MTLKYTFQFGHKKGDDNGGYSSPATLLGAVAYQYRRRRRKRKEAEADAQAKRNGT